MIFTRLRILGFKSFVEAADFVIEPGLTGVVGPNGCGKSNLVEALRWVMGESSIKSMRASGMEDVIFSGSAARPSRNMAEVTLFLDNSARAAPAALNDADELQVSRRIERGAGSAYRVNGREVRARDVQMLFADQSTGARSPAMVGQGKVSELIQAKPQARRALLEEAAGISGLHARRGEAETRLRATEANLERLDDVTGELEGRIEGLKRQARQAVRFKALSVEMRQSEAALFHTRWAQALTAEQAAQRELDAATRSVAAKANAQIAAAKDQADNAGRLPALREAEAQAAAALVRLGAARSRLEEEEGRIRARAAELDQRLRQNGEDRMREERMVQDRHGPIAQLDTEEGSLNAQAANHASRLAEAAVVLERAGAALSLSEGAMALLTTEKAEAAAARNAAEQALAGAQARHARALREAADLERALAAVSEQAGSLPDLDEKREVVAHCEAALALAEAAAGTAENSATGAIAAMGAAQGPLGAARTALARVEGEARALRAVASGMAGHSGLEPVSERLAVEPGFEKALSAALGADLDAPLETGGPFRWAGSVPQAGDPPLPAGVESLDSKVQAPPQLLRRLRQVGIVAEDEGADLQAALHPGQKLVAPSGALWRWDGFRMTPDAPSPAAERMAQRNRLAELERRLKTARRDLEALAAKAEAAEAAAMAAVEAEKHARLEARRCAEALGAVRRELAAAQAAAGALQARQAALEETCRAAARTGAEGEGEVAQAREKLAAAPDTRLLSALLDAAGKTVAEDRRKELDARARRDDCKREAEVRSGRLSAIVREREAWAARAADAGRQLALLAEREAAIAEELQSLAGRPGAIEEQRRTLGAEIAAGEEKRRREAGRLAEGEARQRLLDKAAAEAGQALSEAREGRARSEERLNGAESRRLDAEARIGEALGCAPGHALRHSGLEPGVVLPEASVLEAKLERLRAERERLGAVNLRAEEESRELQARLESMAAERNDVIEAVKKLRAGIASLNREGRERLLAAFSAVDGHFRALFTHLFGGGTAELRMVESEDPLEAGVEIFARPPGKKPQTMTLLSGGEQALTALALIFAVFLTNPAPICVLDEVDAPLDDHNVERFCNLLDRMVEATATRFVVITHNPITMARMDRLFGVTMVEQGLSRLVSVDLRAGIGMREAG